MNFIKNTIVYLLLLVFDVKTIVNDVEKLESCVEKVGTSLLNANEENSNLLKLIDQSTVILKAFCSENLINFVDTDDDDEIAVGDDFEEEDERKTFASSSRRENANIVDDDDSDYSDYYFYKSDIDGVGRKLRTLMTFAPITIYKGLTILRQLELFNNQEYFQVKGQLNATLELEQQHKVLYQRKCYANEKINIEGQRLNENHLIEKQIHHLAPGQLIIFGKLDKRNSRARNRLIIKTNGIVRWHPHVENFVWNNLGWSNWSEWSACSKSCKGIQQRYRQCLTNQQNSSITIEKSESTNSKMDSIESAAAAAGSHEEKRRQQRSQHLCNGYNIEQRECNLFECKDAVNLLSLTSSSNTRMSMDEIATHINQVVDKNDFTIMFTIRSQVNKHHHLREMMNQHLISLRSETTRSSGGSKYSRLAFILVDGGMKVVQEKSDASEMFAIKLNLFDLHWHQIAFSFRSDGLVTCYVDCIWDSSFIVAPFFEVPQPQTRLEINSKLSGLIEWKQLSLISGNHVREQCSNERTPIYDNNKLLERAMFNDGDGEEAN